MRIIPYLLISLFFTIQLALAGLPPTCTQGSGDASCLTTFSFAFPNVPFTHSGATATMGAIPNGALANSSVTVQGAACALGGTCTPISTSAGAAHQFSTGFTAPNTFTYAQPAFTDISGTAAVTQGGTGTGTQFTQGSAIFAGASGVYSQDNANFFWDATNHRLSLGTSTESGAAKLTLKQDTNDGSSGIRILPALGSDILSFSLENNGNWFVANPFANVFYISANNLGQMNFGNSSAAGGASGLDNLLINTAFNSATQRTLSLLKKVGQTGDFFTGYDTDGTTQLFKVDIAGKGVFSNLRNTAFAAAGVVTNDASGNFTTVAPGTSGNVLTSNGSAWVSQAAAAGGCAMPVLTKTTDYTIVSGDFTCANKVILVEANCSASCTVTLPAASNSGYEAKVINIGTATATVATAGSDTFGSTADQTWTLVSGAIPQASNTFTANGGSRWDGF